MQVAPQYPEGVVAALDPLLRQSRLFHELPGLGIAVEPKWCWTPGSASARRYEHNLELLRRLGELRDLGRPIVVGTWHKRFIGKVDGSGADESRRRHDRLLGPRRTPRAPTCCASTTSLRPPQAAEVDGGDPRVGSPHGGRTETGSSRASRSSCAALDLHPPRRQRRRAGGRAAAGVRPLVRGPHCDAAITDQLQDTVDYAEVCDIVALAATERNYRTLERLAQVVGQRLMERFGCESVRVRAAKPEPPLSWR